jgi:trimeric autotransporter adhesin
LAEFAVNTSNSISIMKKISLPEAIPQNWFVQLVLRSSLVLIFTVARQSALAQQCTIAVKHSVSGCYQNNGSKTTVSVEVSWANANISNTPNDASDAISVTFAGQTKTINPGPYTSAGGNGTIVSPQVVAFEVNADGSTQVAQAFTGSDFPSSTCKTEQTGIVLPAACPPTVCASGQTGGTVFMDYDANGIKASGETVGLDGVTVKAFDCNGNLVATSTTDVFGKYAFTGLTATNYPIRVEFSGLPSYAVQGTVNGTDGRTTVQFVNAPDCTVDLGILDPTDYCQRNPKLIVPCFLNGNPADGGSANDAALVSFNYDLTGSKSVVAKIPDVGSVWGIAYNKYDNQLYSATFLRRHVGLRDDKLGAIYKTDLGTNTTTMLVDVSTIGANIGSVATNAARGLGAKGNPSQDQDAFAKVGKVGMGDIDISTDGQTLYFVNLFEKKLHRLSIANPTNAPGVAIPAVPCTNGEARPWGLKIYKGKAYVGVVCDGSTGNKSDLRAYVYQYDLTSNTFNTTPVFDFPLTYPKGFPWVATPELTGWYAWTDDEAVSFAITNPQQTGGAQANYGDIVIHPQPILSDIEFDIDGSMVLGFADRFAWQTGHKNLSPSGVQEQAAVVFRRW